jgi:hypothetical protein
MFPINRAGEYHFRALGQKKAKSFQQLFSRIAAVAVRGLVSWHQHVLVIGEAPRGVLGIVRNRTVSNTKGAR